ncbi:MAG TPA: ribonuclease [Allosphingosinicella sp.]|nr:ribonuclease [Allosphingosinicella sp.]
MAEWLYEEGIGENRAILVEHGAILEAAIELPGLRAGSVVAGRLVDILIPGRRGIVSAAPEDVMVEPLPPHLTEGQAVRVEISREPIPEPGHPKFAKGRVTDEDERGGPALIDRIGDCTRLRPTDRDRFEEAGWSELLEDAVSGEIAFPGGNLRMSLTPAMTLLDVDGALPPADLAVAGAAAAARAIRRLGIGGSIGVDLPTLSSREDRKRAAAALDAVLPPPFERTAVNGFGFLQLVRRRERQSLPEQLQFDPAGAAARALLRRAARVPGVGARLLTAAPAVVARIEDNPAWLDALARQAGAPIRLQADPRRPTWSGHVQTVQS